MKKRMVGPWLVALGAALWGTESAFRIPLVEVLPASVVVLHEHVILVLCFLPLLILRRHELRTAPRGSFAYLLFSGVAGSAVGALLFTEALRRGNPTIVNVILNIQPVLSTTFAYLLFRDPLSRGFFVFGPLAILAGVVLSLPRPEELISSLSASGGLHAGSGLAFLCALFWGLSTVAGRGVMVSMSLPLAASLRVIVGLISMAVIVFATGQGGALWPEAARAHAGQTLLYLLLLATVSGGVPLLLYFQGLKLTRASTAGYFEMMQTLSAVLITWGLFGHALLPHQAAAAVVLIAAVALLQHTQRSVEPLLPGETG